MMVSMQMNPISDRTTSTTFKIPKYDLRYSMSHLMPPKTFLAWTGSVVGWYGLLAPEIMEVLEASPSKPSGSSVVLMMVSGETLDSWASNVTTYKPTLTNRLVPPHGAGYVS